jgi:predicted Fe-S protein YdhL (DUF1289 family)
MVSLLFDFVVLHFSYKKLIDAPLLEHISSSLHSTENAYTLIRMCAVPFKRILSLTAPGCVLVCVHHATTYCAIECGLADRENNKRLAPAYAKRRAVLKDIPKFWPVAFMRHRQLVPYLTYPEDQKALLALEDVWIDRDPEESRVFSVELVSAAACSCTSWKHSYLLLLPSIVSPCAPICLLTCPL